MENGQLYIKNEKGEITYYFNRGMPIKTLLADDWEIIEDIPEQPIPPKTHGINSYSLWLNNKISEYNSAIQSCIEVREYDRAAVLAKERDGYKICLSAFEKMVI